MVLVNQRRLVHFGFERSETVLNRYFIARRVFSLWRPERHAESQFQTIWKPTPVWETIPVRKEI